MAPVNVGRLIAQQGVRADAIRRAVRRWTERSRQNITKAIVRVGLDKLKVYWEEYRTAQVDLAVREDVAVAQYLENGQFAKIEMEVENCEEELQTRLEELERPPAAPIGLQARETVPPQPRFVKLPEINLPTFSGRYEDWAAFYDIFTSCIHSNPHLSKTAKLQYLKGCLTGEAAEFVKAIQVTEANYDSTLESLKTRYHSLRRIVGIHMEALEHLPRCTKASVRDLRALLNKVQHTVTALNNLGQKIEQWDFWLVYRIINCLDHDTRVLWGAHLKLQDRARIQQIGREVTAVEGLPTFKDVTTFLEDRIESIDLIVSLTKKDSSHPGSSQQSSTSGAHSTKPVKTYHAQSSELASGAMRTCALCGTAGHYVRACPRFKALSVAERRNEVRHLKLCFNCLGTHQVRRCQSVKRCNECQGRHHSLIHASEENTAPTQTEQDSPSS